MVKRVIVPVRRTWVVVVLAVVAIILLSWVGLYLAPGQRVGKVVEIDLTPNFFTLFAQAGVPTSQLGEASGSAQGESLISCTGDTPDPLLHRTDTNIFYQSNGAAARTVSNCCPNSHNYCVQSSPDLTILNTFSPSGSGEPYCYSPGSIMTHVSVPNPNAMYYCNPNHDWIVCTSDTAGEVTADATFVCGASGSGAHQWTQCTNEGTILANHYCDGTHWQECGQGNLICGRSQGFLCDEEHKYQQQDIISFIPDSYYCSYDGAEYEWIKCSSEVAGEGVDNAPHASRYNNNYLCDGALWRSIDQQCSACQGNTALCIGSSKKYIGTGEVIEGGSYYGTNTNRNSLIGCAVNDECKTTDGLHPFDDLSGSSVCGDENTWLRCDATANNVPSDGGHWMCNGGSWSECDETHLGTIQGSYICSQDAASRYIWYSETRCEPSQQYRLRLAGRQICLNSAWKDCADITTTPVIDSNVQVSCDAATSVITVKETACTNQLDDDHDFHADCEDPDCLITDARRIADNALYQVIISAEDCSGGGVIITT